MPPEPGWCGCGRDDGVSRRSFRFGKWPMALFSFRAAGPRASRAGSARRATRHLGATQFSEPAGGRGSAQTFRGTAGGWTVSCARDCRSHRVDNCTGWVAAGSASLAHALGLSYGLAVPAIMSVTALRSQARRLYREVRCMGRVDRADCWASSITSVVTMTCPEKTRTSSIGCCASALARGSASTTPRSSRKASSRPSTSSRCDRGLALRRLTRRRSWKRSVRFAQLLAPAHFRRLSSALSGPAAKVRGQ